MGWLGAYGRRSDAAAWGDGLVQMGARAYGPGLGRFVREDDVLGVIGQGQTSNRGAYGLDNPINCVRLGRQDGAS